MLPFWITYRHLGIVMHPSSADRIDLYNEIDEGFRSRVEDYGLNGLVREPVILSPSTSGMEAMENSRALNGTEIETSGNLG